MPVAQKIALSPRTRSWMEKTRSSFGFPAFNQFTTLCVVARMHPQEHPRRPAP
jgi:hypothetical protein